MRIGVFGLTGDPCTCAHYEIVKKVLADKLVDKVIVIPTIVDYYRTDKKRLFKNDERLEIMNRWFKDVENVIVDDYEYELVRNTPGGCICRKYLHMLSDLIARNGRDNTYVTIVGGDSWNKLNTWYEFQSLFNYTSFIVAKRDEDKLIDHYIEYPDQCWTCPKTVVTLDKKFASVSATKIRNRLHDMILNMSLGPNATCLSVYLEEVDDYLKTGKTYENRNEEYLKLMDEVKNLENPYKCRFDTLEREKTRESDSMKAYDKLKGMKSAQEDACLLHTPIFDVMECPEVEEGFKPVRIKSNDWVTIVVEEDGKFLIEKQLRHGLGKEFEEFPCGIVEKDELPIVAALRELKEETGIVAKRYELKYLGKYAANPAFMTNYMHYFYVKLKDYDQYDQQLDEHENIEWHWLDKNKAFENFLNSNGSALGGSCWMLLIREGIVNEWND